MHIQPKHLYVPMHTAVYISEWVNVHVICVTVYFDDPCVYGSACVNVLFLE